MWIFAVAEVANFAPAQGEILGQGFLRVRPPEVLADGGVVGGGVGKRHGGQVAPE